MRSRIEPVARAYSQTLAVAAGLVMAALFGIVFINAAQRYLLGTSFLWGEKLPVYLTAYGVMFGAGVAYLDDRHVRFTLLIDPLKPSIRHGFLLIADLVVVVSGVLLAWSGYLFAQRGGGLTASSIRGVARNLAEATGLQSLEIFGTLYPYQLSIAVGGVLLAVAGLLKFATRLAAPPDREPRAVEDMGGEAL